MNAWTTRRGRLTVLISLFIFVGIFQILAALPSAGPSSIYRGVAIAGTAVAAVFFVKHVLSRKDPR